jgi:iron complex outermembrane recepter protein
VTFISINHPTPDTISPGVFPDEIDRNWTSTNSYGGSLQATSTQEVFGHDNHITVGMSVDHGGSQFTGTSELGTVDQNLFVSGVGIFIDQPDADLSPVSLLAQNTYTGIYATDTFDITPLLSLTAGRFNLAQISLQDETGESPLLTSSEQYQRLNPVIGFTYKITPNVTLFAGYSEANRAPTPLELGRSDPIHQCMIDNFLIADPPLQQVVAHTYEAGLRGQIGTGSTTPVVTKERGAIAEKPATLTWSLDFFRTDTTNDMLNVASTAAPLFGFQKAAKTLREGVEAKAAYSWDRWTVSANYTFINATYQTNLVLQSPDNPFANADGLIFVSLGDHIPAIPNQRFKLSAEYQITDAWKLGGDLLVFGSQYLIHDDSNQNPKVPPYWVVNLYSSYQVTKNVEVFELIQNLFDQHYYAAGAFFDTGGFNSNTFWANNFLVLNDPRTFLRGMPFAADAEARAIF